MTKASKPAPPETALVDAVNLPASAARLKRVALVGGFRVRVSSLDDGALVVAGTREAWRGPERFAGRWRDGKIDGAGLQFVGWPYREVGITALIALLEPPSLDDEVASA